MLGNRFDWVGPLALTALYRHDSFMGEAVIDAKYLKCPMPVLRAARALRSMTAGTRLLVLATDPGSVRDFRDYCQQSGHALVSWSETKGVYSFSIRCAALDQVAPPSGPREQAESIQ